MMTFNEDVLAPAKPRDWFKTFFARYCDRLFKKKFNGVRIVRGSSDVLQPLNTDSRPVIVALNHSSWWDPLTGVLLWKHFFPDRLTVTPIEMAQFNQFKFFSMLGLFGIDTASPQAAEAFLTYVSDHFEKQTRPTLVLTPQGTFADVRTPVKTRPGAAAVAAKHPESIVVSVAIEYTFWEDQRPEVFIRAQTIEAVEPLGTAGWLRLLNRGMRENAASLAELVSTRDPSAFEDLFARSGSRVHPVYDLVLRLRGQSPKLTARRTSDGRLA